MTAEHDSMEELVAAFVVGAVDPAEADTVRDHLAGCSSCRELAQRLRRAGAAVPLAVDIYEAPAGLRERVLASAQGAPQLAPPGIARQARRRRLLRVPAWARSAWRGPAAAAALVAFAIGGGIGLSVGHAAFGTPSGRPQAVAQYSLSGTGAMTGSAGRVFDLRTERVTLIQFTGLPALAPGRVYELWLIDASGHPRPGAVFAPDPDGSKLLLLGRSLAGLSAVAVTDEAGPSGVPAPTKQPELVGKLS
jgi:anti-sigma-K factor RskA